MSPVEPGREGVDAKRTGACVFYPVSISADRRAAVVEECVRNERYITFPFSPCAEGEKASGDDEVYVYAYCPEAKEGVLSAPAWRKGKSVHLTLPERWQGKEVHFYGFAVDLDGEASETTYIGCLASTPVETPRDASLQGRSAEEGDGASENLVLVGTVVGVVAQQPDVGALRTGGAVARAVPNWIWTSDIAY